MLIEHRGHITIKIQSDENERFQTAVLNNLKFMKQLAENIMTKLSDFLTAQEQFNSETGAAIDGLVGDVKSLNDKITELQNSPDRVTQADQDRIDALQVAGRTLADRLKALDDQTPPTPPPAP